MWGHIFFKFSTKLAIFGTIRTPVKDFLPPSPTVGGQVFLRGGASPPLNQARGALSELPLLVAHLLIITVRKHILNRCLTLICPIFYQSLVCSPWEKTTFHISVQNLSPWIRHVSWIYHVLESFRIWRIFCDFFFDFAQILFSLQISISLFSSLSHGFP